MLDPKQMATGLAQGSPNMYERYDAISYDPILLAFRGSIAHGTYEPNTDPRSIDDIDLMGIAVPGIEYYLGLDTYGSRGTFEIMRDPWDIVVYEARKAIDLLRKGNPNILSLLWLPEEMYVHVEHPGRRLIENRRFFACRSVYNPFIGYARGQLMKMERAVFEGYMGEKRKRLVTEHGYDTKNAAHLIRLLRLGIEFLQTGEMTVDRRAAGDADELLRIKHGEWPLQVVKDRAANLFAQAERAYDESRLPDKPDHALVTNLCCDVVAEALHLG